MVPVGERELSYRVCRRGLNTHFLLSFWRSWLLLCVNSGRGVALELPLSVYISNTLSTCCTILWGLCFFFFFFFLYIQPQLPLLGFSGRVF